MNAAILNATTADLPVIYRLFEEAIRFQKNNNYIGWNGYDKAFLQSDIENRLLYKMVEGDSILCIFSICYRDALIWREKEKGDAVYVHRVVTDQQLKGKKLFQQVLGWTLQLARERNLQYIRIDTWAANEKIITYYKSYGFSFLENYTTPGTDDLPLQHRNLQVALLELRVGGFV